MSFLIDKECPRYLVLLATLNFVLELFGYELIATLGSPFMALNHTQHITIPYRAVCLLISLILIIRCLGYRRIQLKPAIVCLIIYWGILIARLVYDFYLQWDFAIDPKSKQSLLLQFLGMNLPNTLAFALSWEKVDYGKAFKCLAAMLAVIAVFNIIFNPALLFGANLRNAENLVTTDGRIEGGAALNTISFAHCGVALSLMSLYVFYYVREVKRYIPVAFFCLGAFIALKAGSRGPVVWFLASLVLFYSFKSKRMIYAFVLAAFFCFVIYVFKDTLLDLVKDVSPVLYSRTMGTIKHGDLSGRDGMFDTALRIWQESPLIGKYFTIYWGKPAHPGYTHNVFFDSMIMGGMVGVALMAVCYYTVVKSLFEAVKYSSMLLWVPLIVLQKYLGCMSSGAFWGTPMMSMGLIAVVFLRPYFEETSVDYMPIAEGEDIEQEEEFGGSIQA